MAGAEEVLAALDGNGRTAYSALVLNPKGLERAIAAGAREVHLAYPLTDTFAAAQPEHDGRAGGDRTRRR